VHCAPALAGQAFVAQCAYALWLPETLMLRHFVGNVNGCSLTADPAL